MNIYPDWLLQGTSGGIGEGTIIINGLGVEVASDMSVAMSGELDVSVGLSMPVPVDVGTLAVSLEDTMTVGMEVCDG